jgi:tellurite resistance protein TehA-like permease
MLTSVVLSHQPFYFTGLNTIGKVVFLIDLVLFLLLTLAITTRFILHPGSFTKSLHHPTESFFFGSFWVSLNLILYCIQAYGVPSAGPWLRITMEYLFWIYIFCALLVAIFQYHVIFETEKLSVAEALPAWILPAYPFLVTGTLAGVIVQTQPSENALRIWVAGVTIQGVGWMVAFMMYTIYLERLITGSLPAVGMRPGMYIAVGPAGNHTPLSFLPLIILLSIQEEKNG